MSATDSIRERMRERLWAVADEIGWSSLSDTEKSNYYERWTRDPSIGGQLAHLMDPRKVRVYIKDSLVKPYERARLFSNEEDVWRILGLEPPEAISARFIKPHGRRLSDGRVVCWGNSRDWKLIVMAAFERSWTWQGATAFAVVLFETGKTAEEGSRRLVRAAARQLGLERIEWMD